MSDDIEGRAGDLVVNTFQGIKRALPDDTPAWKVWRQTVEKLKTDALDQRDKYHSYKDKLPLLPVCPVRDNSSTPDEWKKLAMLWARDYCAVWAVVKGKEGLTAQPVDGKAPAHLRKVRGIDDMH